MQVGPLPRKGILKTHALTEYIYETSGYPREHEQLRELREATMKKYGDWAGISIPVDQGLFFSLLLKLMNAKRTLEIGVFTGYSLLVTALALPDDGKITAIDFDREAFDTGLPFIKKAGVDHKIDFVESYAMPALDNMLENEKNIGEFDFAFVDAEKTSYAIYHEKLLRLIKVGGVIAYDNTLWYGSVAQEEKDVPENMKAAREHVLHFNAQLSSDPRVEISHVSIGDGLMLCRRLH